MENWLTSLEVVGVVNINVPSPHLGDVIWRHFWRLLLPEDHVALVVLVTNGYFCKIFKQLLQQMLNNNLNNGCYY